MASEDDDKPLTRYELVKAVVDAMNDWGSGSGMSLASCAKGQCWCYLFLLCKNIFAIVAMRECSLPVWPELLL